MGLRRCLALLVLAWAGAQAQEAPPLALQEIAPGVQVQLGAQEDWLPANGGKVSNLGFVVGQRCVAVVDTGGSLAVGQQLRLAIARVTPLPVCYVINTHAHPDHVLGNAAFLGAEPAPVFVGHAKLEAALSRRAPYYLNALRRDFHQAAGPELIVPPSLLVDTSLDLDLGGRSLRLQAWPTAHTDHDLSVFDTQTRTLFGGDLVFVGHMPVLDGRLRGWLAVMDQLKQLDAARLVPGHGPVSEDVAAAMAPQAAYLGALLTETRQAIRSGATLQQAVDSVGHEAATPWLLAEVFHRRNVTAAFAELEWDE